MLNINKKIFINIYMYENNKNDNFYDNKLNLLFNTYNMNFREKNNFFHITNFIEKNLSKNKLFGNVILEDLVKKIFHPKKIIKLLDKYNYFDT
jgi:hypothetical protein